VCLLEMKALCAGSACGSWAPRQRPSPPALLPPATPKRAPVLPMLKSDYDVVTLRDAAEHLAASMRIA
jgi:hypothetical protein